MERDFGVAKALPELQQNKHDEVVDFLQKHDVDDAADLKAITVDDLTEKKLLPIFKARRLVKYWQKGEMSSTPMEIDGNRGANIRQNVHGNVDKMISVDHDYNETNNHADTMNNFNAPVKDVQTGGKRSTKFHTEFKKDVKAKVVSTGQGSVNYNNPAL